MTHELKSSIAVAQAMASADNTEGAMTLTETLMKRYPEDMEVWLLRSYLHELNVNYSEAKGDLSRAIELNGFEPHLFYSRGRCSYHLGELKEAIQDFSKALELCDFYKNDYYRQELHFWRAETLVKLGSKDEALRDLSQVEADFSSWKFLDRSSSN
ncbi:tetratricopeptide repeat protein [Terriglobus saanensis]|uniref:tetratricopeptide repeat protein n=1 Tax=Terriglobus saanensis TaxID=870903 RepID=UPI00059EDFC7|nr:tetratricopeptide repeat protein [Terriglobus saanensis]